MARSTGLRSTFARSHPIDFCLTEAEFGYQFMQMKNYAYIAAILLSANHTSAGEFVVGLGAGDHEGNSSTFAATVALEYHTDPFYAGRVGAYSWGGAVEIDEDNDVFLGLGIHANWNLGNSRWFVEGSIMPGYYDHGQSGTDLGGNFQFRTLIGLGYELKSGGKVSVAIDHKSNGGIEGRNPGEETLMLRYSFKF